MELLGMIMRIIHTIGRELELYQEELTYWDAIDHGVIILLKQCGNINQHFGCLHFL